MLVFTQNMDEGKIKPDKWYTASEAAPFLRIKEATLTKQLREKKLIGKKAGARKEWFVQGKVILKRRKDLNLDGLD